MGTTHACIDSVTNLLTLSTGNSSIGYQRLPLSPGTVAFSDKGHHKYLTMVVDHDRGRLVWAAACRDMAKLRSFFDLLGEERSAKIPHVSADAAYSIAKVVALRCPQAVRVMEPFHVVQWATDALDTVRREVWNAESGGAGRATPGSKSLKTAHWALWKNPAASPNASAPSRSSSRRPTLSYIAGTCSRRAFTWR